MSKEDFPLTKPWIHVVKWGLDYLQSGNHPPLMQRVLRRALYGFWSVFSRETQDMERDFAAQFPESTVYPEDKRRENIRRVNSYQDQILQEKGFYVSLDAADKEKRRLIAYYRWVQATPYYNLHVRRLMYLLKKYVEWWYSTLFDTFNVVYRSNKSDYLPWFRDNTLFLSNEKWFEEFTSLYANTIHFHKGTPAFLPWTIPILTVWPLDQNKYWLGWRDYVPLDILSTFSDGSLDCNDRPDFTETMHDDYIQRLFFATRELEAKMLEQANYQN